MTWLTPELVQGVCGHMNDDHAEAALAIVRTLGGLPLADSVTTTAVDERSITFLADVAGAATEVVVPFAEPANDRQGVRTAVVELSARAQGV